MFSSYEGLMKRTLDELVASCGRPVGYGGETLTAALYPVTDRSRRNLRLVAGELGMAPAGVYVYIGPLEPALEEGGVVTADGVRYRVRRAETLALGETQFYRWGLLTKEGEPWT